ncbi:MAG: hypothetical protein GY940_29345 [bacterium]|nr:hypothetical protein [bacterium]
MRFARTQDGYTILQDADSRYVYAEKDRGGNMVMSDVQANDPANRRLRERRFLKDTGKEMFYTTEQLEAIRMDRKEQEPASTAQIAGAAFPSTGTRKVLVLLIGFADRPLYRYGDQCDPRID